MKADAGQRWMRRSWAWLRLVVNADRTWRFLAYTGQRFLEDRCQERAAGLGYVTLLSLVPLFAIALGVLSAFPAFSEVRLQIQALIFENFMPETGAAVTEQITAFIENAGEATGSGVLAFALVAVLLLNNINGALNEIWRVAAPRPIALRFLVYWALLSLGPLLVGASLSVSSYAFATVQYAGIEAYTSVLLEFARLISIALSTLGFALLYFIVPNRAVHPGHALFGGFVAAVLFELLKAGFGVYVRSFTSYEAIYGAIAAVPVFLVWLYLSWVVVLLGAEFAAALPEWRATRARGRRIAGPGERLALALAILSRLYHASQADGPIRERTLIQGLPATPAEIDVTLGRLRRRDILVRSSGGRWALSRDLGCLTLGDLAEMLDLDLAPGAGWPRPAERVVADLADAGSAVLSGSVARLLTEAASEQTETPGKLSETPGKLSEMPGKRSETAGKQRAG